MLKDIRDYVQNCKVCATHQNKKYVDDYIRVNTAKPFEMVGLDIMPINFRNHEYNFVVATDYFTKWTEAINVHNTAPNNQRGNGQVERTIGTLKNTIKKIVDSPEHKKLGMHSTIKMTPYKALFGIDKRLPFENIERYSKFLLQNMILENKSWFSTTTNTTSWIVIGLVPTPLSKSQRPTQ